MCGADDTHLAVEHNGEGLPPRVRSRPCILQRDASLPRITSACAEQTRDGERNDRILGDYLRVCGADDPDGLHLYRVKGLPPRVRSRLPGRDHRTAVDGITSACAEQTDSRIAIPGRRRDYLRVCGADSITTDKIKAGQGLPPRVRSRLVVPSIDVARLGITSACAEQTGIRYVRSRQWGDYLRVCGADPSDHGRGR